MIESSVTITNKRGGKIVITMQEAVELSQTLNQIFGAKYVYPPNAWVDSEDHKEIKEGNGT